MRCCPPVGLRPVANLSHLLYNGTRATKPWAIFGLAKPGATDFDFLFGTWRVHYSKLKHRLAGETDWIEFDGEMICWPVVGGLGNVDDNLLDDPSGAYRAMSLRSLCALSGPTSRRNRPAGNRRSPMTTARPGNPIGS